MVTVTVRLIRSFEYRTVKNLVLKDVDLSMTVSQFKKFVQENIMANSSLKPYHNNNFDTMKLYVKAHGAKTTNLVINLGDDESKVLRDDSTLTECGIEDETEISYYNMDLYKAYLDHPDVKW